MTHFRAFFSSYTKQNKTKVILHTEKNKTKKPARLVDKKLKLLNELIFFYQMHGELFDSPHVWLAMASGISLCNATLTWLTARFQP